MGAWFDMKHGPGRKGVEPNKKHFVKKLRLRKKKNILKNTPLDASFNILHSTYYDTMMGFFIVSEGEGVRMPTLRPSFGFGFWEGGERSEEG